MQWPSKKVCAFVAAGTLLLGGGATAAYASIPDANGTIHGCRDGAGNVRIIDSASDSCLTGETSVDWQAEVNLSTYTVDGTSSGSGTWTADCNAGDLMLSGYRFTNGSVDPFKPADVHKNGSGEPIGFEWINNSASRSYTVICLNN